MHFPDYSFSCNIRETQIGEGVRKGCDGDDRQEDQDKPTRYQGHRWTSARSLPEAIVVDEGSHWGNVASAPNGGPGQGRSGKESGCSHLRHQIGCHVEGLWFNVVEYECHGGNEQSGEILL